MSDDRKRRREIVRDLVGGAAGRLIAGRRAPKEAGDTVREALVLRSQQATIQQIHQRFTERARAGNGGVTGALEALDAMWTAIRQLRVAAPEIVSALSSKQDAARHHVTTFYAESTELLEDAIRVVFAEDLGQLALPPERMAVLVRVVVEGLIVELAQASTAEDVEQVDQVYADMRTLFERFVLSGGGHVEPLELEPIPLPW